MNLTVITNQRVCSVGHCTSLSYINFDHRPDIGVFQYIPTYHSITWIFVFVLFNSYTVYRKLFTPFCAKLRLGEFQCQKLSFFKENCVWANSGRGETVCKSKSAKITREEDNLVYNMYSDTCIPTHWWTNKFSMVNISW